jgi:hypothetical protein
MRHDALARIERIATMLLVVSAVAAALLAVLGPETAVDPAIAARGDDDYALVAYVDGIIRPFVTSLMIGSLAVKVWLVLRRRSSAVAHQAARTRTVGRTLAIAGVAAALVAVAYTPPYFFTRLITDGRDAVMATRRVAWDRSLPPIDRLLLQTCDAKLLSELGGSGWEELRPQISKLLRSSTAELEARLLTLYRAQPGTQRDSPERRAKFQAASAKDGVIQCFLRAGPNAAQNALPIIDDIVAALLAGPNQARLREGYVFAPRTAADLEALWAAVDRARADEKVRVALATLARDAIAKALQTGDLTGQILEGLVGPTPRPAIVLGALKSSPNVLRDRAVAERLLRHARAMQVADQLDVLGVLSGVPAGPVPSSFWIGTLAGHPPWDPDRPGRELTGIAAVQAGLWALRVTRDVDPAERADLAAALVVWTGRLRGPKEYQALVRSVKGSPVSARAFWGAVRSATGTELDDRLAAQALRFLEWTKGQPDSKALEAEDDQIEMTLTGFGPKLVPQLLARWPQAPDAAQRLLMVTAAHIAPADPAVLAALRQAYGKGTEAQRDAALRGLEAIAPKQRQARTFLLQSLAAQSASRQIAIAYIVAGEADALPQLAAALAAAKPDVERILHPAYALAGAIGLAKTQAAFTALERELASADPYRRAAAGEALLTYGDAAAKARVTAALARERLPWVAVSLGAPGPKNRKDPSLR